MATCIYCRGQNLEPSAEHVVADALGGSIQLSADYVCKDCNNRIDQEIDRSVQKDLAPILAQLAIPGKRGNTTAWTPTETVDGEERRFRVTKDEIFAAESRKLLAPPEGGVYSFRATSPEELERAREEIAARNPGHAVVLGAIVERRPGLPESRIDDVAFDQPHWRRWAAKTVLNVIAYVAGRDVALRSEFDGIRGLAISGGDMLSELHVGGIGGYVAELPDLATEHTIVARVSSEQLLVQVTLFKFCGCSFSRRVPALPDRTDTITLDAIAKRLRP